MEVIQGNFFYIIKIFHSDVADVVMRNLGRVLKRDQGLYSIMMKWVGGFIDVNVMVPLMAFFLKLFPDYKKMNAKKIN